MEESETVALPREMIKILYDLAINSLDFGSGFWGYEEYDVVRRLASMIGAEYPRCGERSYPPGDDRSWSSATWKSPHAVECEKPKGHPAGHTPWAPACPAKTASRCPCRLARLHEGPHDFDTVPERV